MKTIKTAKRTSRKSGQMIVEYAVMFAVIVAVIIFASKTFLKPALCEFFNSTSAIINTATTTVQSNF